MKKLILLPVAFLLLMGLLAACGIKDPPKYVPQTQKTDAKKAE
jgi:predicted small lipoprotein YifL